MLRPLMVSALFNVAACCSSFTGMDSNPRMRMLQAMSGMANYRRSAADFPRAQGKETFMRNFNPSSSITLGVSSTPPISHSSELTCFDFNANCRWRNVEGFFVDELNWFQGTGELDRNRIQRTTGANTIPDGSYAIVATHTAKPSTAKAVLAADPIPCQLGPGQLSFKYWTSPQVRIRVCVKRNPKSLLDFEYCSNSVEIGDPGPVSVRVPEQSSSFQLFIVADNFVFNATDLQGGFAIIDDIEYNAEICNYIELNQDTGVSQTLFEPSKSLSANSRTELTNDQVYSPLNKGWHDAEPVTSEEITPMRKSRI